MQRLQEALAGAAPRLQAVFEKPGAQELVADLQWGLLQRFTARGIKFAAGLQDGGGGGGGGGKIAASSSGGGGGDRGAVARPGDGSPLLQAQS